MHHPLPLSDSSPCEKKKVKTIEAQLAMAFLLPNLSPSFLLQTGKSIKEKPISTHSLSISSSSSSSSSSYNFEEDSLSLLTLPVQAPPAPGAQVKTMPSGQDKHQQHGKDEFYINLGLAIRTLREDLPLLFTKDLNYDIYRSSFSSFFFKLVKEKPYG